MVKEHARNRDQEVQVEWKSAGIRDGQAVNVAGAYGASDIRLERKRG